jgi:hypothetical protein
LRVQGEYFSERLCFFEMMCFRNYERNAKYPYFSVITTKRAWSSVIPSQACKEHTWRERNHSAWAFFLSTRTWRSCIPAQKHLRLPLGTESVQRREREIGGKRKGVAPGRDDGVCSLHQELAEDFATYALPIKSKGGFDEEPAGAPGLRFLPLAFSSLGMGPRR